MIALYRHRHLIREFVKRALQQRYRGSVLGAVWAFAQPLFMLAVYTIVFSGILGIRFSAADPPLYWPLYMLCGLLPWSVFNETLAQSPRLILNYPSLVKKVVFPLEILPATVFLTSLTNSVFGLTIMLIAAIFIKGLSLTVLWLPLLAIPLALWSLGLAWLLSSLGVFLRDLGEIMGLVLAAWFFLTPIFYPLDAISAGKRWLFYFNPMTHVVRDFRRCGLDGLPPEWLWWGVTTAAGLAVCWLGFRWFARTKVGFADVV